MAKKKSEHREQRITLAEAKSLYKDEWVVFRDAKLDLEAGDFIDGVVHWHGPDQKEAYRKAGEVQGDGATYYTGSIPYKRVTLREDYAGRKRVA